RDFWVSRFEVMHWCGCGVLLVLCIGPLSCLTASPCPAGCCCPPLSVARNQLCNVDHLLRPFSNLENNRIRAIQPGALQGLYKLQVLTLKGNNLTSLPLNLPPSLTHLDLSANCISALDLPSLSFLVNLQVLKINSNCLRSVPESAFDRLPRLRSVSLANNLWACECDILYLYRWLMSGRLKMATDLVCTQPVHLAHRLLLNLSVMAICPRVLRPNESMHRPHLNSSHTIFFIMVLYLYISC
uniref:Si:ch211-191d15.2 n=1 Tax=Scophthalmus maximus TaxID=52904 RepID=A0A8D3E6C9_SCOMX